MIEYINSQKYYDCQLISAINAYYYFGGKLIDNIEYEILVDKCNARFSGQPLYMNRIYKDLGIKVIKKSKSILNFLNEKRTKLQLPLEVSVWETNYGYHSVLIVDFCSKSQAIKVTNFRFITTKNGWMFLQDLYKYRTLIPDRLDMGYKLWKNL
jgi:hypothetical protein